MKPQDEFEALFRSFVKEFGGEILPEPCDTKIADYLFRSQNIVAELKCLVVDQTAEMNNKVTRAVKDLAQQNEALLSLCDGKPLEIAKAPKEISDPWLKILIAPIENVIRDANRQIRSTKERLSLPFARGLLLVFNQGNLLHNHPQDFRLLAWSILRKRTPDGELRFPHIHAVVYFSFETVKARQQNMSFWAPMLLPRTPDEDVTQMKQFQKDLQQGWYAYVEKTFGRPVRQHAEVGVPRSPALDEDGNLRWKR
jgi:hypothetical protein